MIYAIIFVATIPPINPSIVLLGEIRSISLCLPILLPTIYANESLVQIKINTAIIIVAS